MRPSLRACALAAWLGLAFALALLVVAPELAAHDPGAHRIAAGATETVTCTGSSVTVTCATPAVEPCPAPSACPPASARWRVCRWRHGRLVCGRRIFETVPWTP